MSKIEQLINACKELNLEFDVLTSDDAKYYIRTVLDKYTPKKTTGHVSIGDKKSVILNTDENEFSFSEKFDQSPIRIFFDQENFENDLVFELNNGQRLGNVLGECFGMEYFVSNPNVSFLVSVNWYSIEIVGDIASKFE